MAAVRDVFLRVPITNRTTIMADREFKTPQAAALVFADNLDMLAIDLRKAATGDLSFVKPTVELHYWSNSLRTVPTLSGFGAGHPTFRNGEIHTSQLFFIDPDVGLARTFSRWYRLGPKAESIATPHFPQQ